MDPALKNRGNQCVCAKLECFRVQQEFVVMAPRPISNNNIIKVDGKNKWLGYYKDLEQAVAARKAGEAKYYNLPETENY
jgi:hypothetical protein